MTVGDDDKRLHRNDIYGDVEKPPAQENPAIPAATVVLLRDGVEGVETLMLHRTSKVHFGGMWVFPGGRIDPEDYPDNEDVDLAARNAAAREALEETGVSLSGDDFVHFANWTPPPTTPRRYATWFFATEMGEHQDINVDGHEIQDHQWIHPGDMLARHEAGEVDLAPPTWITLHYLAKHAPSAEVLKVLADMPSRQYVTRIAMREDGVRIAMWEGDAGYDATDANLPGARHRLVLAEGGFLFENTIDTKTGSEGL